MHKNTVYPLSFPTSSRSDGDAAARRQAVVEVVAGGDVANQAELASLLERRGYPTTQATLSRDLKALRIGKVPKADGYAYVLPESPRDVLDESRSHRQLAAVVREVRIVGNLVLLGTPPGQAQAVGRIIEGLRWEEVQGQISGDDTIMVVTLSAAHSEAFRLRLVELTGRSL